MGYTLPPKDGLDALIRRLIDAERRIAELERPTGTQTAGAVKKLQDLVNGILTQVNGVFSGYVQAGGNITSTSGIVQADAGLWSTAVYNDVLSTAYRATWSRSDGKLGYVPSSARFKTNIAPAVLDGASLVLLALRVVTFQYVAAVEELGEEAVTEWGLIAEEVDELGLTWLVDYDEEGLPFGVKYERVPLLLIMAMQDQVAATGQRIDALEMRLEAAGL